MSRHSSRFSRQYVPTLRVQNYNFAFFLYGCGTWSFTLREERRLRVFDNRVLRRTIGPKGVEVTGEWRKLHNEELNDLYFSSNIVRVIKSKRMRWAGHVTRMGESKGVRIQVLGGET